MLQGPFLCGTDFGRGEKSGGADPRRLPPSLAVGPMLQRPFFRGAELGGY